MQLAEVADRLYAANPDDFMSLRTEQVAAAKAAGDKALAKEIGQLRKPTRAAWLVNLLARDAAQELAELLTLGAALREAQQSLDVSELRSLSTARSKAVNALSRRAVELGAAADYAATEAVRQEVSETLQAALADPDQGELVRLGVVSSALSYGGFGPFSLATSTSTSTSTSSPAPAARSTAEPQTDVETAEPQADGEEAAAAAKQEAARAAWQQAQEDLATAEAEADRATANADALADQVDELRRHLSEAEQAETEARRAARQARKRVDELATAERVARAAVEAS